MGKKALLLVGVVILASAGAFFFAAQSDKPATPSSTETQKETEAQKSQDDTSSNDRYVEYTKVALEQNADKRRVLYFYASWCPTCRPADKNFKENSNQIPEDTRVIRVNYNDPDTDQEEKDLAKKYSITYQHTFVQIDKEANVVTKWNGGQIEELLKNIK